MQLVLGLVVGGAWEQCCCCSHTLSWPSQTLQVTASVAFFQNEARGKLYVDDGHSFDYKKGSFLLREFRFSKNKLSARYTHIHLAHGDHMT